MSLVSVQPNKPNRLDAKAYPNKDTNEKYHLDYAKWAIGVSQTTAHSSWLNKIKINKNFYKGDQWMFNEDLVAFLEDSSGNTRNRIKMVHNMIRPMVEQYRGNASILKINATAKSISKLSVNRRDLALSQLVFKTKMANELPGLGEIMRMNDKTIGKDETETTQIFENLYVDLFVSQINSLLKYIKNLNDFEKKQVKVAQNLALSGLIACDCIEYGGHRRYPIIESEDCFWDTDAKNLDLTDAAFCGYVMPSDVSSILEAHQVSDTDAKAMEDYVSTSNDTSFFADNENTREYTSNRLPVYKVYFRDTKKIEYGYVMDEYDYPYLTKINFIEPGEESPKYTDEDLIDPPKSPKNDRLFKGKKKRKMFIDYIRFCTFVPGEVVGKAKKEGGDSDNVADIVLDFGMVDYQETEYLDLGNVKFPMKFQTWGYVDGEVFSPVDDAINPQRFINRVLSVTEQLINNSGGSGMIIDEDAIPADSEGQIFNDSKEGKPITVRTRGKGVPNTVGYYDNTPKAGVYNMFGIIPTIKSMIQDTTGVNEALKGESTGSDQLVGVTELLIQRGSLMQEPFYNAISDFYVQMYQDAATVGKRMYIDNERELAIITGDEGVEILTLSKELRNEDFRVFVSRENDDTVLQNQANQMLDIFLERGLIDDKVHANHYNRSTPDDVTMALRSQAGLRIEAARRQGAQEQEALMRAKDEQDMLMERDRQDKIDVVDKQNMQQDKNNNAKSNLEIDKAILKEEANTRG